jgi:hypothetical protein
MAAIEPRLIEKLEKLPRERLSEVEDFVEFLAASASPAPFRSRPLKIYNAIMYIVASGEHREYRQVG